MPEPERVSVEVERRRLSLSNLDKVLYRESGFTKAQVIEYYRMIGPVIVPHLKERPLTLKRYPDGVEGKFFYEKNCPAHRPSWVKTAPVYSSRNRKEIEYCVVNDLPSLIWAANLASLELHTSLSLSKDIMRPTMLVFDLDPGPPATIAQCSEVALMLREMFEGLRLSSVAKTSGSKGLQVYVPLNTPVIYDNTKPFAHAVARTLESAHPKLVVSSMSKEVRGGKVFVDWSQNDEHKTTICVYSLRARERPTVSTPVSWDEVERCARKKDPDLLVFDAIAAIQRVEKQGDLFEPLLKRKQKLPALT